MIWTNIKRISKSGFINFWRNGFISFASISIMTITLCILGVLIFSSALFKSSLQQLKNKVDINVYFVTSAQESDILALKKEVEGLPEVQSAEYLSRDEVLAQFKERHQDDNVTLQAINELNENPLQATLNIKAKEAFQYESISQFLESKVGSVAGSSSIIGKISYRDPRTRGAIDTFSKIIESGKLIGTIILAFFITISIVISFIMIQLVIYSSREEISVMRLVGASTQYIKGPFMVTGIMYGVLAGFITLLLLYAFAYYVGPSTWDFFRGINLSSYYVSNFTEIFFIIMGAGVALGALSSYLAVRRYLTL